MSLTISKFDAELKIASTTFEKADVNVYTVAADTSKGLAAEDEYEIVLKEAPKSNVFTLPFTMKGVVFGPKQLPLNQELNLKEYDSVSETEAWKDGKRMVYRPENVVGSYPIYADGKSGNEYGTGKIAHLYRPEAIDAKGNRVWCDLLVKDGLIIETVPQKFLDSAIYPVTVT